MAENVELRSLIGWGEVKISTPSFAVDADGDGERGRLGGIECARDGEMEIQRRGGEGGFQGKR